MKSLEVKFNEALAELKKKAPAKKYDEVCQQYMPLTSIEAKLNCVEQALASLSESVNPLRMENLDESLRDPAVAVLFGVDAKRTTTNKEAAPIKKHNGSGDNFIEGNPFNGDRKQTITENKTDVRTRVDKATADGLLKCGSITEAEHAKLVGKKPAGYEQLSEQQRKDYDFARLIGISEADAFKVAKLSGSTFKEVSR